MLREVELAELDSRDGFAVYVIEKGKLEINTSHPFVAAFQEAKIALTTNQKVVSFLGTSS